MTVSPAPRRMRWWMAIVILTLTAVALAVLQVPPELDNGFRFFLSCFAGIVGGALLTLWFVFFTNVPWRTKLSAVALLAAAAAALRFGVRVDGFTGDMMPRLAWSWLPKTDLALADEIRIEPPGPEGLVDLATTAPFDFPQFLGPDRNGVAHGVYLARDWASEPPKQLWRQPIGAGWSSFAVVGKYAVTQEQRGDKELIVCYEVETGKPRWTHADNVRFSETMGGDGPRATPTIHAGRVYAIGATGILNCLDGATGKPLWSRDTLGELGLKNLDWGKSCSPLIVDNLVIVTLGDSGEKPLAAYHKDSGEPVWRSGHDRPSYSSPVLAELGGVRQVLITNAESVAAHAPAGGELLWEFPWPGEMAKCAQPVPLDGDRVLLTTGYMMPCHLLQIKKDNNGKFTAESLWNNLNLKTKFTSPVVRGDHAYGLDDGMLVCLEIASGKRAWKGKRYGHGQVLLVDDLLLIQAESGDVALAEAKPGEFRELGRFPALSNKTWPVPAIAGPYLLVRNDKEAACYRLPRIEAIADPGAK